MRTYFCAGAPTGQTSEQAPQSMHFSGSMSYLPSPSEIACTGHSGSHAPQLMHSSEMLYAMVDSPPCKPSMIEYKNLPYLSYHAAWAIASHKQERSRKVQLFLIRFYFRRILHQVWKRQQVIGVVIRLVIHKGDFFILIAAVHKIFGQIIILQTGSLHGLIHRF